MEELPSVLWSYETTPHKGPRDSPFHLCFGVETLVLIEIGSPSPQNLEFHIVHDERLLWEDLLFRENTYNVAAKRDQQYKRVEARYHNLHIWSSGIQEEDWVLRKNQVSKQESGRKLDATWEGPYQVLRAHENGSYVLIDSKGRKLAKTWNDTNLRKYCLSIISFRALMLLCEN